MRVRVCAIVELMAHDSTSPATTPSLSKETRGKKMPGDKTSNFGRLHGFFFLWILLSHCSNFGKSVLKHLITSPNVLTLRQVANGRKTGNASISMVDMKNLVGGWSDGRRRRRSHVLHRPACRLAESEFTCTNWKLSRALLRSSMLPWP